MDNKVIPINNEKIKRVPLEDINFFDSDTIGKSSSDHYNNDGGGSDMDKYATKEELKHTQELLSEKIDHRSDVIEEKITSMKSQIESSNKILYWILGIFGAVFTSLLVALLTK
ncbi:MULTISPECIES: hypothetical protein [Companilactobacillus]|uniref:Uncharacterized protein n=1 Tax=Companilactobacillus halodurans TaxID=2584183 RepID=A0A5P0ZTZ7_9LACO|nr:MULTISPECIES: hypothetical protein [Companilactobacillus]MQS75672.1 hypothetical protein [Companilactobacillus halodurans]MQS96385.1 hypothetical protein [Companilactobacillus halodurans]